MYAYTGIMVYIYMYAQPCALERPLFYYCWLLYHCGHDFYSSQEIRGIKYLSCVLLCFMSDERTTKLHLLMQLFFSMHMKKLLVVTVLLCISFLLQAHQLHVVLIERLLSNPFCGIKKCYILLLFKNWNGNAFNYCSNVTEQNSQL